ncbi:6-hydroxymethylpterin diphosphokinase MptE-like protein [Methanoregula sp. UBA64]|jgi:2-amino-4-hydroxy-6-hydroxymethyldihydropteridine diphosphokinase|uniref:6-hydroxymethylpterin diphosphokinase MptE-like protein n=1 Tax=Methanoregula sp. UBA64 TaxID=1915554 RepID=UPI0025CB9B03|nr:6-hydroxymethylpterin diphosphokinase MptE-like protein [Methanoregula sp. UBA64]
MEFAAWEPHYVEILAYFGFSREDDEKAAELLATLVPRDDCAALASLIKGRDVVVCGNAPCLAQELGRIQKGCVVLAADAAADVLYTHGIRPDAVFTDLDGATDLLLEMNAKGTIVVAHAHGDNIPLLNHWARRFTGPVVATTQSRPLEHVYNFGGFSDGDRAVFAADALGARSIAFAGFDLDDKDVDPVKRGKLAWAKKLLALIGHDCKP